VQALWELDQSIFRTIHMGWHRDWLDPLFFVISSSGLGWVQILVIFGLLPWRRAWRDAPAGLLRLLKMPLRIQRADWRDFVGPLLLSYAFSSLFNTGILKRVIERERPSNLEFAVPQETFFYNAFPSGHTATSFGIATMLVYLTASSDKAWVGRLALVWAVLVGFSRVYRGVHWPSDVLGGALVGIGSASLAWILLSRAREAKSDA
jgi:membrane-associated phospholipid phosphatase